jgi:hypothetical protein
MISAQPNRVAQERLIAKAMQTPNQYVGCQGDSRRGPSFLVDHLAFANNLYMMLYV